MSLPLLPIIRRLAQSAPGDTAAIAIVVECAEDTARRAEEAGEETRAAAYWETARIARSALLVLEAPPAPPAAPATPFETQSPARVLIRKHGVTADALDKLSDGARDIAGIGALLCELHLAAVLERRA